MLRSSVATDAMLSSGSSDASLGRASSSRVSSSGIPASSSATCTVVSGECSLMLATCSVYSSSASRILASSASHMLFACTTSFQSCRRCAATVSSIDMVVFCRRAPTADLGAAPATRSLATRVLRGAGASCTPRRTPNTSCSLVRCASGAGASGAGAGVFAASVRAARSDGTLAATRVPLARRT